MTWNVYTILTGWLYLCLVLAAAFGFAYPAAVLLMRFDGDSRVVAWVTRLLVFFVGLPLAVGLGVAGTYGYAHLVGWTL